MSLLAKEPDANDAFGQSIALNLKSIPNKRTHTHTHTQKKKMKYKIQELLFEIQFGNLTMPLNIA